MPLFHSTWSALFESKARLCLSPSALQLVGLKAPKTEAHLVAAGGGAALPAAADGAGRRTAGGQAVDSAVAFAVLTRLPPSAQAIRGGGRGHGWKMAKRRRPDQRTSKLHAPVKPWHEHPTQPHTHHECDTTMLLQCATEGACAPLLAGPHLVWTPGCRRLGGLVLAHPAPAAIAASLTRNNHQQVAQLPRTQHRMPSRVCASHVQPRQCAS